LYDQLKIYEKIAQRIENIKNKHFNKKLLTFLKHLDKSIQSIEGEEERDGKYRLWIMHKSLSGDGTWAPNITRESAGTRKLIELFPLIYNALETGAPFVCDEIDKMLHPVVFKHLIHMFNSLKYNKTNAQLIFTAHDTFALDSNYLRLDEVHIINKNMQSVSAIERLSEMPGVYAYPNMELDFRTGVYGSFPKDFKKSYIVK
jgi:hypothetical protein